MSRYQLIRAMQMKLIQRVLNHSLDNYQKPKHKKIAFALMYGASPRHAYNMANPPKS